MKFFITAVLFFASITHTFALGGATPTPTYTPIHPSAAVLAEYHYSTYVTVPGTNRSTKKFFPSESECLAARTYTTDVCTKEVKTPAKPAVSGSFYVTYKNSNTTLYSASYDTEALCKTGESRLRQQGKQITKSCTSYFPDEYKAIFNPGTVTPPSTTNPNPNTPPSTTNPNPGTPDNTFKVKLSNPLGNNITNINQLLTRFVQIALDIGLILASLAILWSGFLFVKAQGDSKKITDARNRLQWSVIGLAILLASNVIVTIIKSTVESLSVK